MKDSEPDQRRLAWTHLLWSSSSFKLGTWTGQDRQHRKKNNHCVACGKATQQPGDCAPAKDSAEVVDFQF